MAQVRHRDGVLNLGVGPLGFRVHSGVSLKGSYSRVHSRVPLKGTIGFERGPLERV